METSLLSAAEGCAAEIAHGHALAVLDFPAHHGDIVFANPAPRAARKSSGPSAPTRPRKFTRSSRRLTADASGPSLHSAAMSSMAESQALVEIISASEPTAASASVRSVSAAVVARSAATRRCSRRSRLVTLRFGAHYGLESDVA